MSSKDVSSEDLSRWLQSVVKFKWLGYLHDQRLDTVRQGDLWSPVLIPYAKLPRLHNFVGKDSTWIAVPQDEGIMLAISFKGAPRGWDAMAFCFLRSEEAEMEWLRAVAECRKITIFAEPDPKSVIEAMTTGLTVECAPKFSAQLVRAADPKPKTRRTAQQPCSVQPDGSMWCPSCRKMIPPPSKFLINRDSQIFKGGYCPNCMSPLSLPNDRGTSGKSARRSPAGKRSAASGQYDEYDALHMRAAAADGDTDEVMSMIARGVDPDAGDRGWTALLAAANGNHADTVKALIRAGVKVNARYKGWTVLMAAANAGHVETVEALIGGGADVNAKKKDGVTALFLAAMQGRTAVVKALLAAGADADYPDSHGVTPRQAAFHNGHQDIVKLLDSGKSFWRRVFGK